MPPFFGIYKLPIIIFIIIVIINSELAPCGRPEDFASPTVNFLERQLDVAQSLGLGMNINVETKKDTLQVNNASMLTRGAVQQIPQGSFPP